MPGSPPSRPLVNSGAPLPSLRKPDRIAGLARSTVLFAAILLCAPGYVERVAASHATTDPTEEQFLPSALSPITEVTSMTHPVIAIDPGHGGREPGAVHRNAAGRVDLVEKDVNLSIALRLQTLLEEAGYSTVLTRSEDAEVNAPRLDRNGDGRIDTDDDLQARVDVANEAGAVLLFSIHNNGSVDPRMRGTSTYYSIAHPRGAEANRLAALLQEALLFQLHAAGYDQPVNLGFHDDARLGKPYGHLFLVGPQTPRVARVSEMPGVVGESLFMTSDREAALLQDPAILDAIAQAYFDAAASFLSE